MSHGPLIGIDALDALTDARIFDCRFRLPEPGRGEAAFLAGHLPGARYLHLERDLSGPLAPAGPRGPVGGRHPLPTPAALQATLRRAGLRQGQPVVAYDDMGGPFAARLWWMLRWLGHEAAYVLGGGLAAWTAAGRELERGPASPATAGDWIARPDPSALLDYEAVRGLSGAGLVDCRAPERFRGEDEPLDPVAGHIPGAINRFWGDLLDGEKRLVRAPALPEGEWVFYCGSGVTACAAALALAAYDGRRARLYAGSWSDWIARGGEVATGEGERS
jgi:thiosulfate/3-mercaptopyruvate sulfurtransferase